MKNKRILCAALLAAAAIFFLAGAVALALWNRKRIIAEAKSLHEAESGK